MFNNRSAYIISTSAEVPHYGLAAGGYPAFGPSGRRHLPCLVQSRKATMPRGHLSHISNWEETIMDANVGHHKVKQTLRLHHTLRVRTCPRVAHLLRRTRCPLQLDRPTPIVPRQALLLLGTVFCGSGSSAASINMPVPSDRALLHARRAQQARCQSANQVTRTNVALHGTCGE